MNSLLKKYICLVFVIFVLIICLGVSYSVQDFSIGDIFFKVIYGTQTAESSTSTAQSSTSKKRDTENSDDMLDLLARIINAEARGEPYLRSGRSRSGYNE